MDGQEENNGAACISRRCMHVFHRVCVEQAILDRRSCPICRNQMGVSDLLDNPEYSEECRRWSENPAGYTLEDAFFRRYHFQAESRNLNSEDVLRPQELHGQPWNPQATSADNMRFYTESVHRNYPPEEIHAAARVVITEIEHDFADMHEQLARNNDTWDRVDDTWDRVDRLNQERINSSEEGIRQIEASRREIRERRERQREEWNQRIAESDQRRAEREEKNESCSKIIKFLLFGAFSFLLGKFLLKKWRSSQNNH